MNNSITISFIIPFKEPCEELQRLEKRGFFKSLGDDFHLKLFDFTVALVGCQLRTLSVEFDGGFEIRCARFAEHYRFVVTMEE